MRRSISLAVFAAVVVAVAACSMPTAPASLKGSVKPSADYINPNGRSDSTDSTNHQ